MSKWKDPSKVLPFYNTTVIVTDGIQEVEASWGLPWIQLSDKIRYQHYTGDCWNFKDKVIKVKYWKRKDEQCNQTSY